jgi:molybdopterin-guanine dinucleotide biosynthesis protein A
MASKARSPEGVGILLAGGTSTRMGGGDKCLLPFGNRPLLAHVIERLRPQIGSLVINANDDAARFAQFGLEVIPDLIGDRQGPLAGVHAGISWTRDNHPEARFVITAAADTPFLPDDLVERFLAALDDGESRLVVASSAEGAHPVFGLWPVALAPTLEDSLSSGQRKVSAWGRKHGAEEVFFEAAEIGGRRIDPFFNLNRPEDFAEAEALLRSQPRSDAGG